jgi:apolipoprotein N-acyltransferase
MRFATALAATALSGWLYALAFPPSSWKALAWVSLVPFFLALRGVGTGAALVLAWFWAVFASSFVADALPRAVETYFLQPRVASLLFAVFVWSVTGSVYYMLFAPAYRALARRFSAALPLLAAAAWTACELARGRLANGSQLFAGNPWALAGYSQVGFDEMVQIASLAGVYGITFCIAAVNASLAEVGLALWRERRVPRPALVGAVPSLLAVAGALAYGHAALRAAPREPGADAVPVAIVQANLAVGSQWRSDAYGVHLDEHLVMSAQAVREAPPRILFWPESALTFFVEEEPLYRLAISRLLGAGDLELVVGGPSIVDPDAAQPVYRNSVFLLDRRGEVRARYDKRHLVPFAEYLPLRGIDFLRRRFERVRVFAHGEPAPPLPTRAGPAGVLVCNEAMYPEVAGARAREGAAYLVNPSNDTWIQDAVWADRMFDLVSLRAVEQRRWLVRASTSGPSAIVDPWGRVRGRTPPFERAVLTGRIVPREGLSPYGRVGDAFAGSCALAVGAALVLRRARRASPSPPGAGRG